MKKQQVKSLSLKKNVISSLQKDSVKGGCIITVGCGRTNSCNITACGGCFSGDSDCGPAPTDDGSFCICK